ncbi:MAG: hypothetical protein IJT02_02825 [Synergistaceae bacterium]|nr:hypothetical protein [Synergistaceae bacterium]
MQGLRYGEFAKADEYCDRVLDIEPKNARAYLGKLMAELRMSNLDATANQSRLGSVKVEGHRNFTKAMQFADDELRTTLETYRETSIRCRQEYYDKACSLTDEGKYTEAVDFFQKSLGYEDAAQKVLRCLELERERLEQEKAELEAQSFKA